MQNYSDLFFFFRLGNDRSCVHRFTSHALVYVYCGELEITVPGQTRTIKSGEAIFVCKETCLSMTVCRKNVKETRIAILHIPESFLREFYFTIEKQETVFDVPDGALFLILQKESIDSLFGSMIPYYGTDVMPGEKILILKIIEAVYALLEMDGLFYALLFEFANGGKVDILDLLADTYTRPFYWRINDKSHIELTNKLN